MAATVTNLVTARARRQARARVEQARPHPTLLWVAGDGYAHQREQSGDGQCGVVGIGLFLALAIDEVPLCLGCFPDGAPWNP